VWGVSVWVGFDVFKMGSSREVLKKNMKFNFSKYLNNQRDYQSIEMDFLPRN
jgi:hypothetical protein